MNRIQESMEKIQASEELRQTTLQYLGKQRSQKNRFNRSFVPKLILAAACLFFILGTGGYSVYRIPVSYISIDVNPSIELGINLFGRVISIEAYNEDGQDIIKHVALKNTPYLLAIERLMQDENYRRFLSGDAQPVLTIVSDQPDIMMEELNTDEFLQKYGAQTYTSDAVCMKEAHMHEMSFGKYRAYLELSEYDQNVTVEDCHGMTMGEIQNRINRCRQNHAGGNKNGHNGHHRNASGH
ncbi:hypothetical protein FMM75_00280 [Lachnospiraceae bacterium MD335]|nr:hypothetical protein [Lachnospiraceae bacterium MD335]